MTERDFEKAASCGEPSYVWRAGQERRLQMIRAAAGERLNRYVLENGCGVGVYLERLSESSGMIFGLDSEFKRVHQAHGRSNNVFQAAGEALPFMNNSFDMILSHEVLEHVQDDRACIQEMVRVLRDKGRIIIFVPNRGYPFETHGIYWRGHYHFGNIPLVNYLPRNLRDQLAPHVRVYTRRDLECLFARLPIHIIQKTIIFGAYDNIINRWPRFGLVLRTLLQWLEKTPLRFFGLSHFWVVEKDTV